MTATNEQAPSAIEPTAKAVTTKKEKQAPEPQSAAASAGRKLVALKLPAPLAAIARRLASGEPVTRRKDFVTLRDGINARAAELREAKQGAQAKKLARANRLVRRLERAARKGR